MEEQNNEQEMLFKFSMFERQIKEIQQQLDSVERGIVDLNSLNFGLDELIGNTGKEIYAPMGKGIFVKAKLISEELTVDIGNGNLIKKTIPDTKELIEEQIKKLGQVKKELESNLEQLSEEINRVMNQSQEHEHSCGCGNNPEDCECDDDCECEKDYDN
ncbi:Prefoldin subunit alpha [uncultured archaeon]|nr:Prefoldin subunit alpha [uncultured archaeon]